MPIPHFDSPIGRTILINAIMGNSPETVAMLLKAGVDSNIYSYNVTPLIEATLCNHHEIVQQLLNAGANPKLIEIAGGSRTELIGKTALDIARENDYQNIVQMLSLQKLP